MKISLFILLTALLMMHPVSDAVSQSSARLMFSPETYTVQKAHEPLYIDGSLNEKSWQLAKWTSEFIDIQGDSHPKPRYRTKVKMLWDSDWFYIAAELEEPHVWATITEYDSVIFSENDFEVFIDPDGDTHNYYEIEVNALGTIWDLMLTKPYRNGGMAVDAWDIKELDVAVNISGTINDPADTDSGWTVEMAIPWSVLEEAAPGGSPVDGTQWRVNFSRVQWQTDISDGVYRKRKDPGTGRELHEDNWTWSPQGLINMHYPERWGYVQFSDKPAGSENDSFNWKKSEDYKWLMRVLYYRQADFFEENRRFATSAESLGYEELYRRLIDKSGTLPVLSIKATDRYYLMQLKVEGNPDKTFYIREDSKTWAD